MHRRTKIALELLQVHKSGFCTPDATTVDGRGKGSTLYINLTTASALARRGFATIAEVAGRRAVTLTELGAAKVL